MKYACSLVLLLFALSTEVNFASCRGINGGLGCAACTIVSGVVMHIAEVQNETILLTSEKICRVLPNNIQGSCLALIKNVEPILTSDDLHGLITPDVLCYGLHFCHVDEGESYCHLFPKPDYNFHEAVQLFKVHVAKNGGYKNVASFDICDLPFIRDLCTVLYDWFENMQPAVDIDDDSFSPMQIGRGSYWRGRDCSDFSESLYPGRKPLESDQVVDSNCNGIFGVHPSSGKTWEEELCDDIEGRGLVVVGDSVGAHFHMPEPWFDATTFTWSSLNNLSDPLFDELDWPQLSFSTGFLNLSDSMLIKGKTDSIYLRLRERNRCNHRDYQNLCRNGETSFDHVNTSAKISRDQNNDRPVLLLYELLGNDVCNNSPDTLGNMTTPVQFRENALSFLQKLDSKLPNNSHVILVGLFDGSRIYPDMAERYHPLGRLHKNIKYKDVYKWFLCMQIGPCNGWMNQNATIRKSTTARAVELSYVLKKIADEQKQFKSFNVHYIDSPLEEVIYNWEQQGGKAWQLYEAVDSFHPNQIAQPLIADVLWNRILKEFPEALGDVNPKNDVIKQVFGDQGGH